MDRGELSLSLSKILDLPPCTSQLLPKSKVIGCKVILNAYSLPVGGANIGGNCSHTEMEQSQPAAIHWLYKWAGQCASAASIYSALQLGCHSHS